MNILDKASEEEAVAGVDDSKWMTPKKTLDAAKSGIYVGDKKKVPKIYSLSFMDKSAYPTFANIQNGASSYKMAEYAIEIGNYVYYSGTYRLAGSNFIYFWKMHVNEENETTLDLALTETVSSYDGAMQPALSKTSSPNKIPFYFRGASGTWFVFDVLKNKLFSVSASYGNYALDNCMLSYNDSGYLSMQSYNDAASSIFVYNFKTQINFMGAFEDIAYFFVIKDSTVTMHKVNLNSKEVNSTLLNNVSYLKPICRIENTEYCAVNYNNVPYKKLATLDLVSGEFSLTSNETGALLLTNHIFIGYDSEYIYLSHNSLVRVNRTTFEYDSYPFYWSLSGPADVVRSPFTDYGPIESSTLKSQSVLCDVKLLKERKREILNKYYNKELPIHSPNSAARYGYLLYDGTGANTIFSLTTQISAKFITV